jgi:hypothetical protein
MIGGDAKSCRHAQLSSGSSSLQFHLWPRCVVFILEDTSLKVMTFSSLQAFTVYTVVELYVLEFKHFTL